MGAVGPLAPPAGGASVLKSATPMDNPLPSTGPEAPWMAPYGAGGLPTGSAGGGALRPPRPPSDAALRALPGFDKTP